MASSSCNLAVIHQYVCHQGRYGITELVNGSSLNLWECSFGNGLQVIDFLF